jgi:F1F0 ATPase subunit 2
MGESVRMIASVAGGLLGGVVLGALLFGGLWLTVTRLAAGRASVLLAPLSLLARLAVLSAGLVLAARFGAITLVACAVGVLAVRTVVVRWVRVPFRYPQTAEKG